LDGAGNEVKRRHTVRLQDKVALITGSGSGIGKATALLFGREGAKVMSADLMAETARATASEIVDAGGQADSLQADVSVAADVERMVNTTVERFGRLDILINNAGIEVIMPIVQVPEAMWDRLIDVNLKGVFLGCKYAIPQMIKQGGGAIVNTASIAGLRGFATFGTYSASKGGVVLLTKTLAVEYAQMNIRINCVCPGIIRTPMLERGLAAAPEPEEALERIKQGHPMGRLGEPEEVAKGMLFLASDEASFITGVPLPIDGGIYAGPALELPLEI
jgi:NAD(P)-dependent dehydrogenase (short-subunit alcohol dehydrogenase family)